MKRFPISVWAFALFLAMLTSLPYLVGQASTPPDWTYSGAAPVPVGAQVDFNSHLAKMWQGYRGEWDYHLLFTHEAHPGLPLVQGFYIALGALARLMPFSLPAVYHIARFALTAGMVLAIWAFTGRFFERPRERWLGVLFGTLVTGVSWVLLALDPAGAAQISPIEFWLIDAYNPLGALYMPHFAAAVTLQIVAFLAFEAWLDDKGRPHRVAVTPSLATDVGVHGGAPVSENQSVVGEGLRPSSTPPISTDVGAQYIAPAPGNKPRSGGVNLIILTLALAAESLIQPYVILLVVPLLGILAVYHVFNTHKLTLRRALWLAIPLGVHAGLVGYQYLVLSGDPVWAAFTRQNITLSPSVTYYLLGYLPFILPAAAGLRVFMMSESDDRWWLPLLWVGLVAGLLYAPFPTQRRYLLGVQTPLAIIAAYGWSRAVLPWLRPRLRLVTTALYFAVTGFAFIGLVVVNIGSLLEPYLTYPPPTVYYDAEETGAYEWLIENRTSPDELVLTTADENGHGSGGRLVAAIGQRVYLGHWIETVDYADKIAQVRRFYDPDTPDSWQQDFLREIGAVYVWYDAYARAVGDWNPGDADYLTPVFDTGIVVIYRVNLDTDG